MSFGEAGKLLAAMVLGGGMFFMWPVLERVGMAELSLLLLVVMSFTTPKKHSWATLSGWAVYWGCWTAISGGSWLQGRLKFGPTPFVFFFGALLFTIAAVLSFRQWRYYG